MEQDKCCGQLYDVYMVVKMCADIQQEQLIFCKKIVADAYTKPPIELFVLIAVGVVAVGVGVVVC